MLGARPKGEIGVSDEMWSYGDDGWTRVPHYWPEEIEGEAEALRHAGFNGYSSEAWGFRTDPSVEIFQHAEDHEHWLVELTIGGSQVHTIEVRGLPNLVDLTAKL